MQIMEFLGNPIITYFKLGYTVITSFKHGVQYWDGNILIPLYDVLTELNAWWGAIVKEEGTAR